MIRVSELIGPPLDYWTARADEELDPVIGYPWCYVTKKDGAYYEGDGIEHQAPYQPSTEWAQGGALIEKYFITPYLNPMRRWDGYSPEARFMHETNSPTPLVAICRAVVRAKFGDEVPDINE